MWPQWLSEKRIILYLRYACEKKPEILTSETDSLHSYSKKKDKSLIVVALEKRGRNGHISGRRVFMAKSLFFNIFCTTSKRHSYLWVRFNFLAFSFWLPLWYTLLWFFHSFIRCCFFWEEISRPLVFDYRSSYYIRSLDSISEGILFVMFVLPSLSPSSSRGSTCIPSSTTRRSTIAIGRFREVVGSSYWHTYFSFCSIIFICRLLWRTLANHYRRHRLLCLLNLWVYKKRASQTSGKMEQRLSRGYWGSQLLLYVVTKARAANASLYTHFYTTLKHVYMWTGTIWRLSVFNLRLFVVHASAIPALREHSLPVPTA